MLHLFPHSLAFLSLARRSCSPTCEELPFVCPPGHGGHLGWQPCAPAPGAGHNNNNNNNEDLPEMTSTAGTRRARSDSHPNDLTDKLSARESKRYKAFADTLASNAPGIERKDLYDLIDAGECSGQFGAFLALSTKLLEREEDHKTIQRLDKELRCLREKDRLNGKDVKSVIGVRTTACMLSPNLPSYKDSIVPAIMVVFKKWPQLVKLTDEAFNNLELVEIVQGLVMNATSQSRSKIKTKIIKLLEECWSIVKLCRQLAVNTGLELGPDNWR
ncbi:hypothetical protein CONPUDRAFT_74070 [Coniophora puteana RWD-64-598 SS2]|uniref:CLASP N-terminal domain-containing protein n=1 Tax=Coniophora puteana (strain RWD-64-598) TaxID=741705 RepID=A0A5M3MKU1_CONPW|nr:uncharacterized protein CONPUDRAFT_74070 [Coniophora puteana RWD-64-598 SS2]EIW79703.1 hypothetical protein CONPUDRAFT_74070 [Coniophora puteana RWD-64-598 SS2]